MTGLLGGNGAGKTTTIAMILGLVAPTSGTAKVLGAEMPRQRYQVLHRVNFESPYVDMPHRLTVRQNLKVFGKLYAVADLGARISDIAAQLELTEFLDRPTGKLSAGQKTRVALAKALINQPDVLLLDEPTASLDPDTADWVRARLERFRAPGGGRDGAALSVSPALILAAHSRADLLADDAIVRLGISAALHFAERRIFCARRWNVHRRGAAVGHPVPRPARILGVVSR